VELRDFMSLPKKFELMEKKRVELLEKRGTPRKRRIPGQPPFIN